MIEEEFKVWKVLQIDQTSNTQTIREAYLKQVSMLELKDFISSRNLLKAYQAALIEIHQGNIDTYLEFCRITNHVQELVEVCSLDDTTNLLNIIYNENFNSIGFHPYYLEQLCNYLQLKWQTISVNSLQILTEKFNADMPQNVLNTKPESMIQLVLTIRLLNKFFIQQSETDFWDYMTRRMIPKKEVKENLLRVLNSFENYQFTQTIIFTELEYMQIRHPLEYQPLIRFMVKADIGIDKHKEYVVRRITNVLSQGIQNGYVLPKLESDYIRKRLEIEEEKTTTIHDASFLKMLKRAQKKSLCKKMKQKSHRKNFKKYLNK